MAGESCYLPESITEWILKEPGDVLESSPSLSKISWLLGSKDELSEITVSFLGEGSVG